VNTTTQAEREIAVSNQIIQIPLRQTGRIAGVLYLIIIVAGIYAQFFVRSSLIVPGEAAATAANVASSHELFRTGLAADLIMILSDVALAVAFFVLLRPISTGLSLLAAFFRLVQASILGANLLNLFIGMQLALRAGVSVATEPFDAVALIFFDTHSFGYAIGLAFFGVSILVLGYLVYRAAYLPSILGVLLMIAAFGYLTDTFARILLPGYAAYEMVFTVVVFVPAIIAELSMAIWLLVKGVRDVPAPSVVSELASSPAGYA
jgi:hypothetical protein